MSEPLFSDKKIATLFQVVERFRREYPEIPAQTICAFLAVAGKPDCTLTDLTAMVSNLGLSSASRNVSVLMKYREGNTPGLNLVEQKPDFADRRIKRLTLTKKGESLMTELKQLL